MMEVEVKARIGNLEIIRTKLESQGATFGEAIAQSDKLFKTPGWEKRESGPGDFILRLRSEGDRNILTWKAFTDVRGAWLEHETGIHDPLAMERIILGSGFVLALELNKERTKGQLGEFELCLDKVNELGDFLEVALDSERKEEPRERIREFLGEVGIRPEDMESRGYPEMIFESQGIKIIGQKE